MLEEAVKLRENNKYEEGKKILKELKDLIKNIYRGNNKDYLLDIDNLKKCLLRMICMVNGYYLYY